MYLPRIVKVAVDQASFHFDKLYSYTVPESLEPVSRGCRVVVPFGGGNRKRQAIVIETDTGSEVANIKPISSVLDATPLVNDEQLDLALWLKQRTFCTVFDAVRTMIPTGFSMKLMPVYRVATGADHFMADTHLSVEEKRLLSTLCEYEDGLERGRLLALMALESDSPLPQQLVDRGYLLRTDIASQNGSDATVRMARLTIAPEEVEETLAVRGCTAKQVAVVRLLAEAGEMSVKEVCYFAGVTTAVLQTLIKKGLVELYEREVLRSLSKNSSYPPIVSATLSEEQQAVYDGLLAEYRKPEGAAALLFGVTGSGKTQIYMNLIDRVLEEDRQVLMMVPEISLTPQLLHRFLERYGARVAVLHSGLSVGERMDEWKRIKRGEATIVIGTRSAVFAPFTRLGLIVMDEEQEHTYKSESNPRYHARDVARYRCAHHKALLLLGSATPSLESYHAAKNGRYALFTLQNRFGNVALPEVEVADLRGETLSGSIGERLREGLADCLANEKAGHSSS